LKYAHYVGTNFFTALAIIFFNIPANVVHSGSSVLSSCLQIYLINFVRK